MDYHEVDGLSQPSLRLYGHWIIWCSISLLQKEIGYIIPETQVNINDTYTHQTLYV
jgi:hypothetical protein